MPPFAETELLDACRVLFGSELRLSRDFLYYIQPSGVKSAYRRRAKETHPDRFIDAPEDEYSRQTELFRDVSDAYKLLESFSVDDSRLIRNAADAATSFNAAAAQQQQQQSSHYSNTQQNNSNSYTKQQSPYTIPDRQLETGLFLYYRGVITYAEMIEALVWQRRQRPVIGTLAENWGWLKPGDVQRINAFHGRRGRFGKRAVDLGCLTPFQVQVLLRHQRQMQKRFGQYFVEQGMLTPWQIECYIREQRQHNARFNAGKR